MKTDKNYRKSKKFLCLFLFLLVWAPFVSAQPSAKSNAPGVSDIECEASAKVAGEKFAASGTSAEKSINVNEKVAITLCVAEGEVKINGWQRNEIRAFVNKGSQVGFSVLEKSKLTKEPVLVKVLGYDPAKNEDFGGRECLYGQVIELDVPFGATVKIKSGESKMTIESVTRAYIENDGGNLFLNNIGEGIDAKTYEGNVTVKNSSGAMSLETTTGNIVAYQTASGSFGDFFRARTIRGAITLQQISYRDTEINSSSGTISFLGKILSGGQYYFGSSNSSITLVIPADTSAKIVAFYGYGKFDSEIPFKDLKKDESSDLKSFTAIMGSGDARINFKTVNGTIEIKKQKETLGNFGF